ncbi:MAG: 3-deoxy-D-manno-octulosonic acid transferase [Acidobacteriota bacterium]
MRSPKWWLYQLGMGLALLLAGPILLLRRGGHYWPTLAGRLGGGRPLQPSPPAALFGKGSLWLHAVSVGEAGVAATLARELPADLPLVVTTITPTGQERARAAFAGRATVTYLPFDLGMAIDRFFARTFPSGPPRALVLLEGDYWPLLLAEAKRRGFPVLVANGRVGDKGFGRMRRIAPLARRLLGAVDRFGVQSEIDRDRLIALGVPPERIAVTGNLKYDTPEPGLAPELSAAVTKLAAGRSILIAGSTMPGEEEALLAATAGLEEHALLILAPRHPERWGEVGTLLDVSGRKWLRRTSLDTPAAALPAPAVLLLDSLGELAGLYRIASAAFIGGTLVPTGGHNPLEAARFAVPVVVGPSMHNFAEMAARFDGSSAWRRAADANDLGATFRAWLDDPEAARNLGRRGARLVEENRGAVARTLDMIRPLIGLSESAAT